MTKIMIVDDNVSIVETITTLMEKNGYQTETASNGEELLQKVTAAQPDLLLLDVMMPGLTTRQILEGLKQQGLSQLKIILVTVVRFSEEQLKALEDEFSIVDYITKPFNIIALVEKVQSHCPK